MNFICTKYCTNCALNERTVTKKKSYSLHVSLTFSVTSGTHRFQSTAYLMQSLYKSYLVTKNKHSSVCLSVYFISIIKNVESHHIRHWETTLQYLG
jgi:hypothetical protein